MNLSLQFFRCRCIPDTLYGYADTGGHTAVPNRVGNRAENAIGCLGCVEHHPSLAGWHRNLVVHSDAICGSLLQRDHHVGFLLPFQQFSGK